MSLSVTLTINKITCECGRVHTVGASDIFDGNITHNLREMAQQAGLYNVIWRPNESGIITASQLIGPIMQGLAKLKADPEKYRAFNPKNGWGTYESFVLFLEGYLDACRKSPYANVSVWG